MRVWGILAIAGCVSSAVEICEDGRVCPPDTTCRLVSGASYCAEAGALAACVNVPDGMRCDLQTLAGTCRDGVCIAAVCGNGALDYDELCDDGNTVEADGCSADCASDERCGNGVVDVFRGEQCDDGEEPLAHDGCSNDCARELPTWRDAGRDVPFGRSDLQAVYDARRRRVLLLAPPAWNEQWMFEWDGARWEPVEHGQVMPPFLQSISMAYDAARAETVVFTSSSTYAETWVWDGRRWTLRLPTTSPPPRQGGRLVYDARRQRTVLFGGIVLDPSGQSTRPDDTWAWNGTDWVEIVSPTRPPGRSGFAMAYDAKRDRVVVFGGVAPATNAELWELDGDAWTERTPATGNIEALREASMAFDPVSERILLAGGLSSMGGRDATYAWDGTAWQLVGDLQIVNGVVAAAIATDPVRRRVVLYTTSGLLREWNGTGWEIPEHGSANQPVDQTGGALQPREYAAMVHDPLRAQIVMFGGRAADGSTEFADTWVWSGTWRDRTPSTPGPTARFGAAIAYDEARGVVVLFGGGDTGQPALTDTWTWDGTTWSLQTTTTDPGPRCHASMTYDARRQQLVLVGGTSSCNALSQPAATGTWLWDGNEWSLAATTVEPPGRASAALAYDRRGERVVLFGGLDPVNRNITNLRYRGDTWTWDGASWTMHSPNPAPLPAEAGGMAWDGARGRLAYVSGKTESGYRGDAWEWDGAAWQALGTTTLPPRRARFGIAAGSRGGIVLFGGQELGETGNLALTSTTWRLRWDGAAQYESCVDQDIDGDGLAGCADPDCWWRCDPLCSPGTCTQTGARCGDGSHNAWLETCSVCPADMSCLATCGDFVCDGTESATTCAGDCP